ncbi:MAG: 1-acyl-sn-glycerol-3-phosphate acyltransferase [Caldilineaceae bacterium]|jgi:1-acyl-sn-glycerol-3-phosphate acyltransferase|nr:1-acyl-sn-glycerol-3-phosphate acyltransferase [Caldilineaceae bacterium]
MTAQSIPLRRTPMQTLWYWLFRLLGWQGEYRHPSTEKFIIIVAPHTSNFDFFIGFIFSRAYAMPFPNFLVKDSALRGLIGKLGRRVGGIPVNRSERTNFVDQVADEFRKRERMILAVTPEGTRSRTAHWKTGFYHMAQRANVPVIMASIDYARKFISCGDVAEITGDMDADIARIRAYYADVTPRHPERHGEIRFRPESGEKGEPT